MNIIQGLYVITDEEIFPGRSHVEIARAALDGGAKIIQLRDKSASDRHFYEAAVEIRRLTREAGALFFVNDRIHIAKAIDADGVNVGQSDMPVHAVRKVLGNNMIIGQSADGLEQALQAERDGADYVGFGPVFPTSTKLDAGPVSDLDTLKQVCEGVSIPVVAIGGIGLSNIASVAANGVHSAAVVSAVVCADDMIRATIDLISEFDKSRE